MNEKLIENIASDCGYEALGLYIYLYMERNKNNITIMSMADIADVGAYHNTTTLEESLECLKEFRYLFYTDCTNINEKELFLFPKTEDYTDFDTLNEKEKILCAWQTNL